MARFAEISLIDVWQYGRAVMFPFDISGPVRRNHGRDRHTAKFHREQMGMARRDSAGLITIVTRRERCLPSPPPHLRRGPMRSDDTARFGNFAAGERSGSTSAESIARGINSARRDAARIKVHARETPRIVHSIFAD